MLKSLDQIANKMLHPLLIENNENSRFIDIGQQTIQKLHYIPYTFLKIKSYNGQLN